jgi:aspartyl aminopeptidase
MEQALLSASFIRLSETQSWQLETGGRYYVVRDDSSIIAFVAGEKSLPESGYKIIGAHTDSPGEKHDLNAHHRHYKSPQPGAYQGNYP